MSFTTERLSSLLTGRYRIERELGQGGMATVYLAHDFRHDRRVALKVLKPELAVVIGAARFLAEIKTTANLQHPHILPLHDSGEVDGTVFYVMPFVEGESLRDRLTREKQLPIDDAIRIATEVADALHYAHEHGVIHRDIKPENILLQGGHALVADFGIALAASSTAGTRMTETGMSLGSPMYMSPEQAMGERTLDLRADVYALGCVLYEMLVGDPPFTGSTAQAIVGKVLTERPAGIVTHRDRVPAYVETAVLTALERLPADRWDTAKAFADALGGLSGDRVVGEWSPVGASRTRASADWVNRPLVYGLVAALVAAAAFGASQWRAAHRARPDLVLRVPIERPRYASAGLPIGSGVAITPAGDAVAYIAGVAVGAPQQILIRTAEDLRPHAVRGTELAQSVTLSPDGRWLAFWSQGKLQKVTVDGGTPVLLANLGNFRGASWSRTGILVASNDSRLVAIPERGGLPQPVSSPDTARGERAQVYPLMLADGKTALYASVGTGSPLAGHIAVVTLATGKTSPLAISGTYPLGVVDGVLVYASGTGDILAVRFDERRNRVLGAPVKVAEGLNGATLGGTAVAALSESGALVGQFGSDVGELVRVDRSGNATPLIKEPRAYSAPRLSPDGRRIAVAIGQASRRDIWVYDIGSQTLTSLTGEVGSSDRPEWSTDGARVLFRVQADVRSAIWSRRADLGGPVESLFVPDTGTARDTTPPMDVWEAVMTADGRSLVAQVTRGRGADVVLHPLVGDTTMTVVSATTADETEARPSPDGRWVAFRSDVSGTNQVIVRPLPGPGGQVVVSTSSGSDPVWSRDGKRLYYRDGRKLVEATVAANSGFTVVSWTPLFDDTFMFAPAPHANYDISPDGSYFLAVRPAEPSQLVLVHNWREELRRRMNPVKP